MLFIILIDMCQKEKTYQIKKSVNYKFDIVITIDNIPKVLYN